jgi:hypothetical protein|eukprot:1811109-Prymnesium_polylepis.1
MAPGYKQGSCMASIPIFGGFCAETEAPDACMNRFSNEYTLPPPLKSRRFRVRRAPPLAVIPPRAHSRATQRLCADCPYVHTSCAGDV